MRLYERIWRIFWSMIAAAGFGLAILASSGIAVLLILGLLVLLWLSVGYLLPRMIPGWQPLTVAVGLLSVWSFSQVSLPLGLLGVMTASLSSPALIRRAVRGRGRSSTATPPPVRPAAPSVTEGDEAYRLTVPESMGPLQGLDDRQLCRLWRESFWVLGDHVSPATFLCIVALREACLDELERRDAAALHAWLDSGARASSGPEKYLPHS